MIYIIRHGETDYNVEKRMQGQTDIPLNDEGRNLARQIAEEFKDIKLDAIISSDLKRASETADIINSYHNLNVKHDSRLREFNYGTIEGKLRDELGPEVWEEYNRNPSAFQAETMEDIFERVKNFWKEIKSGYKGQNILVVSHGGPIKVSKYYFDNGDKFDYSKFLSGYMHGFKIKNLEVLKINEFDQDIDR